MILAKCENIYQFFINSGEPYAGMDQSYLQYIICYCVLAGQYLWEPGRYAVLFMFIEPHDAPAVLEKRMPRNVTSGPVLYVAECACKEGMAEIRKRLRQLPWEETVWHRHKKSGAVHTYLRKGA